MEGRSVGFTREISGFPAGKRVPLGLRAVPWRDSFLNPAGRFAIEQMAKLSAVEFTRDTRQAAQKSVK